MTAKASRILYRMDSEVVTLTGDVIIEDPSGTLRGQTVNYDMRSGRLSGGNDGGRVRMRLLPKRSDD